MMYRHLFAKGIFCNAAKLASIIISEACVLSVLLPSNAAFLGKRTALIIPVLCWIAIVITAQSIRDVLSFSSRFDLPLPGRSMIFASQFCKARSGTSRSFWYITAFNKKRPAAKLTFDTHFVDAAFPGTKLRVTSGLIGIKGFAALFTNKLDLFAAAFSPAFAGAIKLLWFFTGDYERTFANWADFIGHAVSIA